MAEGSFKVVHFAKPELDHKKPNLVFINTKMDAGRFEADLVASRMGGEVAHHAALDDYKMAGGGGLVWAKEFAVKRCRKARMKAGSDFAFKHTGTLIEGIQVTRMLELHDELEARRGARVPMEKVLYLLDPGGFSKNSKGFHVLENPKIRLVENAVLQDGVPGKADPETKIAVYAGGEEMKVAGESEKRFNFIPEGIWALARFGKGSYAFGDNRNVIGIAPCYSLLVGITRDEAKAERTGLDGAKKAIR